MFEGITDIKHACCAPASVILCAIPVCVCAVPHVLLLCLVLSLSCNDDEYPVLPCSRDNDECILPLLADAPVTMMSASYLCLIPCYIIQPSLAPVIQVSFPCTRDEYIQLY